MRLLGPATGSRRRCAELPRPATVAAASVIGRVKDASETGAGLVGDRVQSDWRVEQSLVTPVREILEWRRRPFTDDAPLGGDKFRDAVVAADDRAPFHSGGDDRGGPIRRANRARCLA